MMKTELHPIAAEYVRSINERDVAAFIALFADGAVVDDAGRINAELLAFFRA